MDDKESLPPLHRDRSFLGMVGTQFLGAFNDNIFKQMVLLTAVGTFLDPATGQERRYDNQALAGFLFSLPFVLLSGVAGVLADRYSKRTIVVLCKVAEVGIALLGMGAFLLYSRFLFGPAHTLAALTPILAVLFLMGCHSTFFGPPKYGILPEMIRARDLPLANGIFQLTTFTAIIGGTVQGGLVRESFKDALWLGSGACVPVALVGVGTALLLRGSPAAKPGLTIAPAEALLDRATRGLLASRPRLLAALLASSVFWMAASAVVPTINAFGKTQLLLSESSTSLLQAATVVGIGGGFLAAGLLSRGVVAFWLVPVGAWGITASLAALSLSAAYGVMAANGVAPPGADTAAALTGLGLAAVGVCTGLYCLPIQVFVQSEPPADFKGRVFGALNLFNFTGMMLGNGYYWVWDELLIKPRGLPPAWHFLAIAGLLLPVALLYRPRQVPAAAPADATPAAAPPPG